MTVIVLFVVAALALCAYVAITATVAIAHDSAMLFEMGGRARPTPVWMMLIGSVLGVVACAALFKENMGFLVDLYVGRPTTSRPPRARRRPPRARRG
jgi:hypothetical protein